MKATPYKNRYGDIITFVETGENTVEMSGYNPQWIRGSWANDYSDAYNLYMNQCNALVEPDYDYLIEDVNENTVRPMTYQEFATIIYSDKKYHHYLKLVKSDKNRYEMIDPSGGPYISVGSDLSEFFGDDKKRIVEEIQFHQTKIIFIISNN